MFKNNCPFERNFIYSWMTDAISRQTCMGKFCGEIIRKFLCCSFKPSQNEIWSWAETKPLNCEIEQNPTRIIVISLLVSFAVCGCVFFCLFSVYFVYKSKKEFLNSDEEIIPPGAYEDLK